MRCHELPDPPYRSQWGDLACNVAVIERDEDPIPLHDWRADGYLSGEAYRLWSRNTCGLTCLQMVLAADPMRWPDVPCKAALLAQAISWGVLTPNDDGTIGGLYYAPFVRWAAHDFGLEAISRPDLPIEELAELIASGAWYAMASVSYEIRLPERPPTHTGGHLVLVHRVAGPGPGVGLAGAYAEPNGAGPGVSAGPTGAPGCTGEPGMPGFGPAADLDPCDPRLRLVYHNPSGLPGTAESASCTCAQFARFYAGRGILVRRS